MLVHDSFFTSSHSEIVSRREQRGITFGIETRKYSLTRFQSKTRFQSDTSLLPVTGASTCLRLPLHVC